MPNPVLEKWKCHHHFLPLLLLLPLMLFQLTYPSSLIAMDLLEAYSRAKEHDPLFGASVYEHEAAKTLPAQGRANLLPQVQAYGTESRFHYDSAPYSYYYGDFNSESLGISLKQPILNVPKLYEYRQHKIRKKIGEVRFVSAAQDLILRLVEAYFNVLAAGNLLVLVDAEKKAVSEQREQARERYQAGVGTITDVHDAEARHDSVLAREIDVKNDLDIKMLALKRIVGIEPGVLNPLKEEVHLSVPKPDNLEGWVDIAKKNHPLLKSYAYQIDHQEAELKKNRGQHWPSLDLVGGYNRTNTNNAVKIPNASYGIMGVQLNLPVFNGGYTSAKVREAVALLAKVKKDYENALADVTQKLSEAFLGMRGNIKNIEALLAANKSAATSLESNRMSLLAGVRTTIDVLNAERELQQVRIRLLKVRYETLLNLVKLKAHAGTLSEDDLLEINQWLHH